jgi:hypothetical protein
METQLIIRCFSVLTGLLFTITAFGQTSFYKVYSGNGYDKGEGIAQLPDSGFLVTGSSSSFEEAPSQAFLMRLDSSGNFMWSRAYGGTEFEEGKRVMPVPGYGYYIAGTSSSGASGDFDAYLVFTNESGTQQWQQFTDNGAWERVNDAILLSDTSIFVVGQTDSTSSGYNDIFLARYDKTGNLLWKDQWGTSGDDVAYAVIPSTDTTVIIAGTWYVEDSAQNKACLAEVKFDGTLLWRKTYGVHGNYRFNDVHKGDTWIRAIGERIQTGMPDHDIYNTVMYFDGELAGAEEYYVAGDDTRYVAFTPYTAGNTGKFFLAYQTINPNSPTYPDGEDCVISRYAAGMYWDGYGVSYSGVGQDQVNDMRPTSDGYAVSVGFHTTYGAGGNSVFVVKIGDDAYFPVSSSDPEVINIVSLEELNELKSLLVYPNPVTDLLTIRVAEKTFGYTLLDATGKQLLSGQAWEMQQLDLSAQSEGIYFLQISHASGETAVVKIIK